MTKREILLDALASTPADISRLARSLEAIMPNREPDTPTSPQDVIIQLIHNENSFQGQLTRLLSEDGSNLPHTTSDRRVDDQHPSILQLGRQFNDARQLTLNALIPLGQKEWQRRAYLKDDERITLRFLVQHLIEHDIDCTNQLVEFVQAFRRPNSAINHFHPPS